MGEGAPFSCNNWKTSHFSRGTCSKVSNTLLFKKKSPITHLKLLFFEVQLTWKCVNCETTVCVGVRGDNIYETKQWLLRNKTLRPSRYASTVQSVWRHPETTTCFQLQPIRQFQACFNIESNKTKLFRRKVFF